MSEPERRIRGLPAVVAFGGGHGLYANLSALKRVTDRLTAVVTVADDGGSSGRIRQEFGILPPGDLRMAFAALCGDDEEGRSWEEVLQFRFPGSGALGGHAIGNLLLAGVWEQLGDIVAGLDLVGSLLDVQGRVLPMAAVPLEIEAEVIGIDPHRPDDASLVRGQAAVATTKGEVQNIRLLPAAPPACQPAVDAVAAADFLILGPGSWFTSVVPHLLVPGLAAAMRESRATRVLTLNVAAVDDETAGFTAARLLEVLAEHAPQLRFDYVLADDRFANNDPHLQAFSKSLGAELIVADVAHRDGSARHDPLRLASIYGDLLAK